MTSAAWLSPGRRGRASRPSLGGLPLGPLLRMRSQHDVERPLRSREEENSRKDAMARRRKGTKEKPLGIGIRRSLCVKGLVLGLLRGPRNPSNERLLPVFLRSFSRTCAFPPEPRLSTAPDSGPPLRLRAWHGTRSFALSVPATRPGADGSPRGHRRSVETEPPARAPAYHPRTWNA